MECFLCSEVFGCCTHFTTTFRALNAQTMVTITFTDCVLGFWVRYGFKHCFRLMAYTCLGFSLHLGRTPLSCIKLQELKHDLSTFVACMWMLSLDIEVFNGWVCFSRCCWIIILQMDILPPTKHIAHCVANGGRNYEGGAAQSSSELFKTWLFTTSMCGCKLGLFVTVPLSILPPLQVTNGG